MILENLEEAKRLASQVEHIDRDISSLSYKNDRKTNYVEFRKGGQNVDIQFSNEELIHLLEQTTIDFLNHKRGEILKRIQEL